jgi:transposase
MDYTMHLSYKTSQYQGKIYKSYFIAESYREGKKVKKRTILPLGKLADEKAQQIRLICKAISDPSTIVTKIENIVVEKSKPFLDLAVADALWQEWNMSRAFKSHETNSELPTPLIARILTINRCTSPCSHYSVPQWANKTALPEILGFPLDKLNEDKLYYELDKIAFSQKEIEDHLFQMTYSKGKSDYEFVNYDLSTSYFVGVKCKLSAYGRSKDNKPNHKQVLLAMMVNGRGYPFKWDVYAGDTPEVDTLVDNVDACRERFKLKNVTLVFDRGLVSDENLDDIDNKGLKYVTALDKDQIYGVAEKELQAFNDLNLENYKAHLLQKKFTYYDDSLYFKDLGIQNNRRYILGFNPVLYDEERRCRLGKLRHFEKFLVDKNKELKQAQRSRKVESTREGIVSELKRLKIKKYFDDLVLKEISVERINKKGQKRMVKTFEVSLDKKLDWIARDEKLDGFCVFVCNHIESVKDEFIFPAEKAIKAYRDKVKIEDSFKHIKSFVKIRPFCVNTDDHVRAVYSLCVLAYFLNKDLAERRKEIEGIDYLNSKNLYEPFRSCHYVTVRDKVSKRKKSEPVELTVEQKSLLEKLNVKIKMPRQVV